MNILITGPNGFIGSNLVKKLQFNHNIYKLSYRENFPDIKTEILKFNPDFTIHCGWHGGNNYSDAYHIDQYNKNIPNSIKLLEILKCINKEHTFIGFGTVFEYGNKNTLITENDLEVPVDLYGLSKLFLKNYSKMFCENNNIKWVWVRPFYTYGIGDVNTRLIPKVINNISLNKQLKLDKCDSIIDYLYIDDFVDAIEELISTNSQGIYNICSNNQYKIKDIILTICKLLKYENHLTFDDNLNTNNLKPKYMCGSNQKIKNVTKWNPKISLEDGLLKTINFYNLNK
jgi:nucleoside-diphosphate-sugar epimerase